MISTRHLIYLIGRIVPTVIGFGGLIAYSHLLDSATYAEFAAMMAWTTILSGCLMSWIRITMMRFAAAEDDRAGRMIGVALSLQIGLSVLMIVSLTAAAIGLGSPELALVALLAAMIAWSDLNMDLLRARHNALGYGLLYTARQIITVFGSLGAIAIHTSVNPVILGYLLGSAVSSILVVGLVLPRSSFHFGVEDGLAFIRHGLPLSLNFSLASFSDTLDKLLVIWLLGPSTGGVYAFASDLVRQLLATIMDGVSLAALPDAAKTLGASGRDAASEVLKQNLVILLLFGLPAALGLAACGPAVTTTFLGSDYQTGAMMLVPLLAMSGLFRGVRLFFLDPVFQIAERTLLSTLTSLVAAAALGLLCLVLASAFGPLGAALSSMLAMAGASAVGFMIAKRVFPFDVPWWEIMAILMASAGSTASAIAFGGQGYGPLALALSVWAGAITYCVAAVALDIVGARTRLWPALWNRVRQSH